MKAKVLVVDDHSVNRQILGKILSEDYEVLYAKNGRECLDILEKQAHSISAVVLDLIMPVMDGYQVLEAMGDNKDWSKIPVIVSSQAEGTDTELKALALGAQDFVSKPYRADIIRHRIANTIKLRETAALINAVEKDELTGLYNKQFFFKRVKNTLIVNPNRKYALICLDMDKFRLVNDTFGLATGDKLLCYIADLLRQELPQDSIVGNFGGDVFYMLVEAKEQFDPAKFATFVDRINEFPINMRLKGSFGIYVIDDPSLGVSTMCDRAHLAIDTIKDRYDTNYALYDDKIRQRLLDEQYITDCMEQGLEQGQFHVYYQPKYRLSDEKVVGAEALVRWIHPDKGFMNPGEFIPVFEKNGFITSLDRFVWETACRTIKRRIDAGKAPVDISVNVSRADMYQTNIVEVFKDLIAKYNIPVQYLHLEVTETAYTDNPDQIIKVVEQLRALGFIMEMDDFGSGYSSLNMLAEIPMDILKLDMRFIRQEENDISGKGILSFIISLAKWLNLPVIAEGVETKEQIASLHTMDCDYVQGFYFAKPMSIKDFEELLDRSEIAEMDTASQATRVDALVRKDMEKKEAAAEIRKNNIGRTMVIVDDIETNRAVLAATFEGQYDLEECENGKVAWEFIQEHYEIVDVVMLDLLMPVMDGFQLLNKIRQDARTKHLPVIITSQGDEDSEMRALSMNADDFISKPYNPEIVQHRVRNVMANYRLQQLKKEAWLDNQLEKLNRQELVSATTASFANVLNELQRLRNYFDIVRLVDPEETQVKANPDEEFCNVQGCFSVWGKTKRCNNCISLRALHSRARFSKLEYSEQGLFFVISQFVEVDGNGAVIEMVTKLDDTYVDNVFDRDLLFMKLDKLNHELESDELTGLYNRRHINSNLSNYMSYSKRTNSDLGVAMVDIDGLKQVNDTYGHLAGDESIKFIANALQSNFAVSKGDFVARFGGDEFLVVCRNIDRDIFRRRLADVVELIHSSKLQRDNNIILGISAGCVSLSEMPLADAEALIDAADKRLYRAKKMGRNCVSFEE